MKIPFTEYEISISRKIVFCFFSILLYLAVAMPDSNKFIGNILRLDEYDDYTKNDRYYLWLIHSMVFGILMFVVVTLYSPNPSITTGITPTSLAPTVATVAT